MNQNDTVFFDPSGLDRYPNIAAVESFLGGVGRLVFPDGTHQFAESDDYPDVVYSPRLTEDDLEAFCEKHIHKYEEHFEKHFERIYQRELAPPIERFWE